MTGNSNNGATMKLIEKALETEPNTFRTAMGFVLKLRPIPAGKLQAAIDALPIPQPPELPKSPGAEPGDEDYNIFYANEADPGFQRETREYNRVVSSILQNIQLYDGTEILTIPSDKHPLDSDAWIEEVEDTELTLGTKLEVHKTGKLRYVDYLRFYALADADYRQITDHINKIGGKVSEIDVDRAQDSFRGASERAADSRGRNADRGRRG